VQLLLWSCVIVKAASNDRGNESGGVIGAEVAVQMPPEDIVVCNLLEKIESFIAPQKFFPFFITDVLKMRLWQLPGNIWGDSSAKEAVELRIIRAGRPELYIFWREIKFSAWSLSHDLIIHPEVCTQCRRFTKINKPKLKVEIIGVGKMNVSYEVFRSKPRSIIDLRGPNLGMQLPAVDESYEGEQSNRCNLYDIGKYSALVLTSLLALALLWWSCGWGEGLYRYPDNLLLALLAFICGVILSGGGIAMFIIKAPNL